MNRVIVFSLAYNLISEVEQSVRMLYEQNDRRDFEHYIIDLGFPIVTGADIPSNFELARFQNSQELKRIAGQYKSYLCEMVNIGVSQNHENFYRFIKPDDSDVLITLDPDEIANEGGWVKALTEVLRADHSIGYAAPLLVDAIPLLANNPLAVEAQVGGHNVYMMNGAMNYSQIAYSGHFLNKMGGVPYPSNMTVYGGLEEMIRGQLDKFGLRWCQLRDYTTVHTNVPVLYRAWKDDCIFGNFKGQQIQFDEWLVLKKWDKL